MVPDGEFEVRCLPGIMIPNVRMGFRGLLIAAGSGLMGISWMCMEPTPMRSVEMVVIVQHGNML